jgi:UDP-glucose 4-epimerase
MFKNKNILISGGTGSFGDAVVSKIINSEINEIRIFSRDEKKQDDMRKKYQSNKLKFHVGDVRDYQSVASAMRGVDYVFHAAALKQVPSCEFHPLEAVKTNVLGTENILEAAINFSIQKVVCLSTDKAVYPINAMGISKAMMEKVLVAKSRNSGNKTIICGTRYGNVMNTRGSIIPLFLNNIKNSLPIYITDPAMTRFIMTLDDAVNLVFFAFKNAKNGDIYVQKSPATTIGNLAEAILNILNIKNYDIKIIGTRHGEKLFETLCSREEMSNAIEEGDYYRIPADNRNLNYEKYVEKGSLIITKIEDYNSHNTTQLDIKQLSYLLLKLDSINKELTK